MPHITKRWHMANDNGPSNIEFEHSILSTAINAPDTLYAILEQLNPDYLSNYFNRCLLAILKELKTSNTSIDIPIITEKLNVMKIEGFGQKLFNVLDVPVVSDIGYYCDHLKSLWIKRRTLAMADEIKKRCIDPSSTIDEINVLNNSMMMLNSNGNGKNAPQSIEAILSKTIENADRASQNDFSAVMSGIKGLDKMTSGLNRQDLIILAARPAMGKTSLALNIAENVSTESDTPVLMFSLEMGKEQLATRLICSKCDIPFNRFKSGLLTNDEWNEVTEIACKLSKGKMFIDDRMDIKPSELFLISKRFKEEHDIGLVIVDYIQLMIPDVSHKDRRDLELGNITRMLKKTAKDLDIPVIALSQLNRKLEDRKDKRPQLSDLRESGAIEQDADLVWFLYRGSKYNDGSGENEATLIISKHRNGPTGEVYLIFDDQKTAFRDNPNYQPQGEYK